jgi:hypothetical protein
VAYSRGKIDGQDPNRDFLNRLKKNDEGWRDRNLKRKC